MDPFLYTPPTALTLSPGRDLLFRAIRCARRSGDLDVTEGLALMRNVSEESRDWQTYYKMLDRL